MEDTKSKQSMAELILEAKEFAEFFEFFQSELLKRLEGGFLPDTALLEIAELMFQYLKK